MISLLYTGNRAMFDGLLISVISVSENTRERLDINVFTMDLSDIDLKYAPITETQRAHIELIARRRNPESSVRLVDVGALYRHTLLVSPNSATEYTPYCFIRLFADRIPDMPEKLLYLDTDTIVNSDIRQLFDTNIEDYEYAAVLDHYGKIFMGYRYINSGVMLLNLKEIRKTGLFTKAVEMCASKKLFLPDQTALHRLTSRKMLLPRKYNEQKNYSDPETVIQHFTKTIKWFPFFHTRTIKPWQTAEVCRVLTSRYEGLLRKYLIEKKRFEEFENER